MWVGYNTKTTLIMIEILYAYYKKITSRHCLTMSMTIFLRVCLCFLLMFWNMSHPSFCKSLKATAKWWFSSTDSSLYIRANSEPVQKNEDEKRHKNMLQPKTSLRSRYNILLKCYLLELMRNWLVSPGWSTSCIAAAKRAAVISSGVKTLWKNDRRFKQYNIIITSQYRTPLRAVSGSNYDII